jgi:hypothetical protein
VTISTYRSKEEKNKHYNEYESYNSDNSDVNPPADSMNNELEEANDEMARTRRLLQSITLLFVCGSSHKTSCFCLRSVIISPTWIQLYMLDRSLEHVCEPLSTR